MKPQPNHCKERVWASGDKEDCGCSPTVGATGFCKEHLKANLDDLSRAIARAEAVAQEKRTEFDRLYAELEREELPLLAGVI